MTILQVVTLVFYGGAIVGLVKAANCLYDGRENSEKFWLTFCTWCTAITALFLVIAEFTY